MNAQTHISGNGDDKTTLVVVFLRGAADGLTLVAPLGDDNYHRFRPRLAVDAGEAVKLDGFFGLHANLRGLEPAWKDGDLCIVHGAGGESDTRSHFEAQELMEHGGPASGGWLGRFLRARNPSPNPLSAVALAPTLPEVLSGAPAAAAFESLAEFSLGGRGRANRVPATFPRELRRLYELETDELRDAARNTFDAIARIEAIDPQARPGNGATYDERDSFAHGLRQVAQLIKADVGLDAASVDLGGWDSHFTQKTLIEPLMLRLANGLAAFRQDLGARMATTTVVVMTEFGRRVAENSAFGTDHGRGSAMFVLGGGVKGGRVIGPWPGLKSEMLEGPGDLPVWNNYRNVLAPVLTRHGAPADMARIFRDYDLKPLPLYS
ncbi:MAG: DUF1501 domain-containing protein [Chthoniobacteraceae bacterium]